MILVDYSQIATASFFVAIEKGATDVETKVLRHYILNSLRAINFKFRKKYGLMVICCDGKNSWRKDVFPYYKAKRKTDRAKSPLNWKKTYADFEQIKMEIKDNFHYPVIHLDAVEGDDIIATLFFNKVQDHHLVVSSDKDFIQLKNYSDKLDQWNNKDNVFVNTNDPKKYLYDHILSGDSGDGIPNILSDGDTFVTEGKRQKSMGKKKLDEWYNNSFLSEILDTEDKKAAYVRNKKCIDLRYIPDKYIKAILEEFKNESGKKANPLHKYFMENELMQLMEKARDFR